MNIEELELSLRSEFEGQINAVVARLRQDVADFQKRFEAEFEKHREQLNRSIDEFAANLPASLPLENAFKSTITEHLRLARDEGAQIAATAFGEAEKLRTESAASAEDHSDKIRDAVNDISSKRTQAAILTALVDHASHFAPRGAFFIVKNDNFVGWRAFGVDSAEDAVRDVHFPAQCHSTLSDAVGNLATTSSRYGAFVDDCNFLEPLGFGQPAEMYAVPLSARGRGVAVLYVDNGREEWSPNIEALEALVRVAGVTVELLAAQSARPTAVAADKKEETTATEFSPTSVEPRAVEATAEETADVQTVEATPAEADHEAGTPHQPEEGPSPEKYVGEASPATFEPEVTPTYEFETASPTEVESTVPAYEFESNSSYEFETTSASSYEGVGVSYSEVETAVESPAKEVNAASTESLEPVDESTTSFEFSTGDTYEVQATVEPAESTLPPVEFATEEASVVSNGNGYVHAPEPVSEPAIFEPVAETVTVETSKPRLRDRNVELPIEVSDEERKLHNDARRFARLLVSEIKLYNEQKVAEGREKYDLYDRLREAIDRSREMYQKRVQPAVASKFDYFHYELVNGLAETDARKLGGNYPGAAV